MVTEGPQVLAGGFTPAAPLCTLTRGPNTTAYTAQDEVATNGTAVTAIPVGRFNGGSGVIQGANLVYSSSPSTAPAFRLLLFSSSAVVAAGDNVALALSDADALTYIGHIDFTSTQAGGSATSSNFMAMGLSTCPIHFVCASNSQNVYCLLITTNAFTPIANSETIQITLQVEQN